MWHHAVFSENADQGPCHVAVSYENGNASGYVVYTARSGKIDHPARGQQLIVRDLVALTPNSYRSLWRFLGSHDLVGEIHWATAPGDDPAAEIFLEPRMLRTNVSEGTWLRIVDVRQALQERGYIAEGELTIEVFGDNFADWNNGCFKLTAESGQGMISISDATPQLSVGIKALSSLYSGFTNASNLAAIGLISGDTNAIRSADQLFQTPHLPHCSDHY